MNMLLRDFFRAWRSALRKPGYASVMVISLALGIGVNATIFAVVDAVLLKPLPYHEDERLAMLWSGPAGEVSSIPDFLDWRERGTSFEDMAAFGIARALFSQEGASAEVVPGAAVTRGFFSVLGVEPALGRSFLPEGNDDQVVLLSHGLWQRLFASDPAIVGKKISLSSRPYTVLGVLPASFEHPEPVWDQTAEFWLPLRPDRARMPRQNRFLRVVGRYQPGVSPAAATAEMRAVAARIREEDPMSTGEFFLTPLRDQLVGDVRLPLYSLLAAAGFVLLIVCANISNLQLGRSGSKQRDAVVRFALGARRRSILRLALSESLLLSVVSAVLGIGLAAGMLRALTGLVPVHLLGGERIAMDLRGLLFIAGATLFTSLLTAVFPAWKLMRLEVATNLNPSMPTAGRSPLLGKLLVIGEIALTLPLLVASGLLFHSFSELRAVAPGFDPEGRLSFGVTLPSYLYPEPEASRAFFEEFLEDLAALPGVEAVAATSNLPLTRMNDIVRGVKAERDESPDEKIKSGHYRVVTGDFFTAMGIPLLAGRVFNSADDDPQRHSAVISESFARELWQTSDAIGKRFRILGEEGSPWMSVVGVVGDVHYLGLDQAPPPEFYVRHARDSWRAMTVVVRASGGSLDLLGRLVRDKLQERDPGVASTAPKTLRELLAAATARPRLQMQAAAAFAGLALILSFCGIFGVITYLVHERTREIGVRMAFGAGRRDVLALVFGDCLLLAVPGTLLGLGFAFALTRLISHLLYGIGANDLWSFGGATLLVLLASLIACWLPARRAVRLHPVACLRTE